VSLASGSPGPGAYRKLPWPAGLAGANRRGPADRPGVPRNHCLDEPTRRQHRPDL